MKETLTQILKVLSQQSMFLLQLSAEFRALKTVVSELGPEAQNALNVALAAEHSRVHKLAEEQQIVFSSNAEHCFKNAELAWDIG
jgi:hypothetical protein